MKILLANINDLQLIPPPINLIRADTYISVPLALELKKRKHEVFFLCPKGSKINTKKIFTSAGPFSSIITSEELYNIQNQSIRSEMLLSLQFDLYLTLLEADKKYNFDLIHIHTNNPLAEFIVSKRTETPFIFTLHGIPKYPELESRVGKLFKKNNNYFVSISDYQQKSYQDINFLKTIHNGISVKDFPFDNKGGENMLFSGRLKRQKGLKEAIIVSLKTEEKLNFSGTISMDPSDKLYFTEEVMEIVNRNKNLITYNGFIERNKISDFYAKSKLTLFPIQWEEPFGLVMIESMACGTPVVAFARGAAPEVIKDGETGYLVNYSDSDKRGNWVIKKTGIEGMIEAVNKIYSMSKEDYERMRLNCREHVEKKFSIVRMIDDYEKIYKQILKK